MRPETNSREKAQALAAAVPADAARHDIVSSSPLAEHTAEDRRP